MPSSQHVFFVFFIAWMKEKVSVKSGNFFKDQRRLQRDSFQHWTAPCLNGAVQCWNGSTYFEENLAQMWSVAIVKIIHQSNAVIITNLLLQACFSSFHPTSTLTCCVGETPDEWDLYPWAPCPFPLPVRLQHPHLRTPLSKTRWRHPCMHPRNGPDPHTVCPP